MATLSGCRSTWRSRPSSRACSIVTRRSEGLISAARALSSVVLPEFIAPEIRMLRLARTAEASIRARSSSSVPSRTRSSKLWSERRCLRMSMTGRGVTAITAERRLPSGSRRSSSGWAASNLRSESPKRAAADLIMATSSSSFSAIGPKHIFSPLAKVTKALSAPFTSMFSTSSSSMKTCNRPRPKSIAITSSTSTFSSSEGCGSRPVAMRAAASRSRRSSTMSRTAARLMCAATASAVASPRSGAVAKSSATLVRRDRALSIRAVSSLARASVEPVTEERERRPGAELVTARRCHRVRRSLPG